MVDRAHVWTDKKIEEMQRHLSVVYSGLRKSIDNQCKKYAETIKSKTDALMDDIENAEDEKAKKEAEKKYKAFFVSLIASASFKQFTKKLSEEIYRTNVAAASYINRFAPSVYAKNYNAIGYGLQKELECYEFKDITEDDANKYSGVERQTIDKKKDEAWNRRNISNAVLSGAILLLGASVIFGNVEKKTVEKNKDSAFRQASDMMTGAENSGRLDSMYRAYDEGFSVKKYWIATLDNRTRDTHIEYDSMDPVDLDYEYNYGLKIPKDSNCSIMEEVCNCRCRILYDTGRGKSSTRTAREGEVTGSYKKSSSFENTNTINVSQMTYKEWMKWRSK